MSLIVKYICGSNIPPKQNLPPISHNQNIFPKSNSLSTGLSRPAYNGYCQSKSSGLLFALEANLIPQVVSPSEHREARLNLLTKEKELTRAHDALCKERRTLPIVEVTKPYTFTKMTDDGKEESVSLLDLFEGRQQLIIYHFMFDPSWDVGCRMCSLLADSIAPLEHLHSRSTSFVVVSRAPIEKLMAFQKRMGWNFPWVSSSGSDFNYDFQATQDEKIKPVEYNFTSKEELEKKGQQYFTQGEQPGTSCFIRGGGGVGEEGKIYHTYSAYSRGDEAALNPYVWLDMTLLGRQDDKYEFKRKNEY